MFIDNIYNANFPSTCCMLKINMCSSRRTQLQQILFCYFELIVFVCIDDCASLPTFATFPCPPRLNQYLEENKESCLGHYKVLRLNILKIAIL